MIKTYLSYSITFKDGETIKVEELSYERAMMRATLERDLSKTPIISLVTNGSKKTYFKGECVVGSVSLKTFGK